MRALIILSVLFFFYTHKIDSSNPSILYIIRLPAQTLVNLKLAERLNSAKLEVDRVIKFEVAMNVLIKGEILVKTGAIAIGRVKAIENRNSYNHEESITIEVTAVQAVDGSMIDLNPTEATFSAEYTGEPVIVEAGAWLQARTLNDVEVRIEK